MVVDPAHAGVAQYRQELKETRLLLEMT
jgi:hypothetical protein